MMDYLPMNDNAQDIEETLATRTDALIREMDLWHREANRLEAIKFPTRRETLLAKIARFKAIDAAAAIAPRCHYRPPPIEEDDL